jgi:hypothetical protein
MKFYFIFKRGFPKEKKRKYERKNKIYEKKKKEKMC